MAKTLVQVLSEQGVNLQSRGNRWVAQCPFHEGDRDPSFTVYETETYYCFGCKVWGDAYKFLIDKGWSIKAAEDYLGPSYEFRTRVKPSIIKIKNNLKVYQLLERAAEAYHQFLLASPAPLNYLLERGITESSIKTYQLGFTDGFTLRIHSTEEAALAKKIGLLYPSGQEVLSHRITIPNFYGEDKDRLCDFLVGRTIANHKIKYLGLKLPKPLYGFWDVRHSSVVFLAEGQFDWVTLKQWGFPAVVLGGSQITPQNLEALRTKKVVIVPDNDPAGKQMAEQLKEKLENSVILDYSQLDVKDVSELALRRDGQEAFNHVVKEQVEWLTSISTTIWNRFFQGSTLQRHLA